jgi:hypothetical protein
MSSEDRSQEEHMEQKRLGAVVQELTAEMRDWPAWAQPYRPARQDAARNTRGDRQNASARAPASRKRG